MLEGTAAAPRVGCALETQISSPSDWLQDEAPILFVLYYKWLVSAHCLAGQSPWIFFFPSLWSLLSIYIQICFPLSTCLWIAMLILPVCVCFIFTHISTHSHWLSPTVAYFFQICAHTHTQLSGSFNFLLCLLSYSVLSRLLSHSFQCLSLYPSPPSGLFEYSFPFTVPLSSVFFTLVVSVAIITSIPSPPLITSPEATRNVPFLYNNEIDADVW